MIKTKYKRILAFAAALIILFVFLTVPAFAYSNIIGYNSQGSVVPSNFPLRQDCPVPIDIEYYYQVYESGVYASTNFFVSTSLLPFVSDDTLGSSWPVIDSVYFRDSFYENLFVGEIIPTNFNVDTFSSDPSVYFIGDAEFSFSDIRVNSQVPYDRIATSFLTFSLRDFYCWNYSFDSRINSVDSEVSLSFDLNSLDLPLNYIEVYYALAGDTQLNYIKFDASNYSGFSTGDITFTPDMFGYSGDTIVYIYSADIYFWNGLNQPVYDDLVSISFDAHYVFNPFVHNVNYAGSPGGSLPLANYTGWIADAASGFLDFQIYDGFTLGGIFMCIIAFLSAIWFLKLVAGG